MSTNIDKMSVSFESCMIPAVIGVIIFFFIFFLIKNIFKSKGSNIIVVGLENSGKTALYAQYVAGKEVQTQTSVQENSHAISEKNLVLVDVPGNTRLRNEILSKYTKSVNSIVVCIDSANFVDTVRENAEVLFEVLTSDDVRHSKCPILLFCNKQDGEMARGAAAIKLALEREMTTLNQTAASYLSDDAGSTQRTLGGADEVISFEKLPHTITSVGGCCVGPDTDISELVSWIEQL